MQPVPNWRGLPPNPLSEGQGQPCLNPAVSCETSCSLIVSPLFSSHQIHSSACYCQGAGTPCERSISPRWPTTTSSSSCRANGSGWPCCCPSAVASGQTEPAQVGTSVVWWRGKEGLLEYPGAAGVCGSCQGPGPAPWRSLAAPRFRQI